MNPERDVYMVNVNAASGSVFVKAIDFFRSQGGFREDWGEHWVPIVATSIEDAREKGCALPGARPYHRQAPPSVAPPVLGRCAVCGNPKNSGPCQRLHP